MMAREPMRPPDVEEDEEEASVGSSRFHVDRRVNVASIISWGSFTIIQTIALTIAMTYGWTTMGNRLDAHGDRITALERTAERTTLGLVPMSERLVRLEVQLGTVKETTDKIEALIRRAPP